MQHRAHRSDRAPPTLSSAADAARFRMDLAMAGFAAYQLVNVQTGVALYQTVATEAEILQANSNLRTRGLPSRYVPAGTFHMPQLHAA